MQTAGSLTRFPYPWTAEAGLSRVLRDAELWAEVLNGDARHGVKRAAKKRRQRRGMQVVSVWDDLAIGGLMVSLLAGQFGRRELEKEQLSGGWLGWFLLEEIFDEQIEMLPGITPTIESTVNGPDLLIVRFHEWLAELPPSPEQLRPLALIACGFAMRGHRDANELATALLVRDPAFAEMFADGVAITEEDTATEGEVDEEAPGTSASLPERFPAELSMPPLPVVARPSEKPPLLFSEAVILSETLDQWRQRLAEENGKLRRLEELAEDVARDARAVQQLPCWLEPVDLGDSLVLDPSATGASESARLETLRGGLARLLSAYGRFQALADRLPSASGPWLSASAGSETLAELAIGLEARATDLHARLEILGQVHGRVATLLDQLAAADAESGARLVAELPAGLLCDLWRWLFDPDFVLRAAAESDHAGVRRESLSTDEMFGALIGQLAVRDSTAAVGVLAGSLQVGSGELDLPRAQTALAFLPYERLLDFAESTPALAPAVALLLFTAALRRDRPDLLDLLNTLLRRHPHDAPGGLDAVSREFLQALGEIRHRGRLSSLVAELRRAASAEGESHAAAATAEERRRAVLAVIDTPPGMQQTFHLLRIYAQLQFLQPLRPAVLAANAPTAWRQWQALGDLDTMVEVCIAQLSRANRVQPRHRQQTRAYLQHFAENLDRWVRAQQAVATADSPDLARAVARLRQEAGHHPAALALRDAVEAVAPLTLPTDDFGERVNAAGRLVSVSDHAPNYLRPSLLATWPRALDGEATLGHLLSDLLRERLVPGEVTRRRAVEAYLNYHDPARPGVGWLEAARRAAAGDPELEELVKLSLARRREALLVQHADLIAEAEATSPFDADSAEYLAAARRALDEENFTEAVAALEILRDCLTEFRGRNDPERKALNDFLAEVNLLPQANLTVEDLRGLADRARRDASSRRQHLAALSEAAAHPQAADPVRERWPEAVRRLDRPALWPAAADDSELMADAVGTIGRRLRGKWRNRVGDADPSTAVVQRLCDWTPEQLNLNDSLAFERVMKLADLLEEGGGDAALMRFLGESAVQATTPAPASVPVKAFSPDIRAPRPATQISAAVDVAGTYAPPPAVASLLAPLLTAEAEGANGGATDFAALQRAASGQDWGGVRRLVAVAWAARAPLAEDVRQDLLGLYGVARFESGERGRPGAPPPWLLEACVAVAGSRRMTHYLGERRPSEFVDAAVRTALASADDAGTSEERLGSLLERTAGLPSAAGEYLWFADLFRRAGAASVAPKLALLLWERFRGQARGDHHRAALLRLLFRRRQGEALKALVAPVQERAQPLVRTTLEAFTAAETQPEARPAALQLLAALRAQAVGMVNTQPWTRFFHGLEFVRDAAERVPVRLELDSEYVMPAAAGEEPAGALAVEVRVKPSLHAPPEQLTLTLGRGAPFSLHQGALFAELAVRVPLPADMVFSGDGECRLPWRLKGVTTGGKPIDVSDTWTLRRSASAAQLPGELIEYYWPGAKCEPVQREHGFFGRAGEIELIETLLKANPRPRSMMVFGERRIGKTSLLKTLIASLPPERGRICGAFCDVSGLRPPGPGETFSELFFRKVLAALDNRDDNRALLEVLPPDTSPSRLGRDLDASASLFTALTNFAERLERASGGVISRLALFVDEFDRCTAPLLQDRRAEVDGFLWELREVVQRSERIALVLAGSGIQRMLKENYQDALYGSITEVPLRRFNWPADQEAILDTLLPREVRGKLVRPGDGHRVAERAAHLCGGHPMFLALLGSTAAGLAAGQHLTPGLLDRMVEKMVQGEGPVSQLDLGRKVFYEPVFQPLDVLSAREYALARGLFVCLAEHTLTDVQFASFPVDRLFEVSGLPQFADTGQLLRALDRLAKAEAIVNDKARVRISVPLTAAAVREDAQMLREDIFHTLSRLETP